MNNITQLRQSLAFLESKSFDSIKGLKVEISYDSVLMTCWRNEITDDQFTLIKRVFGPLKVEDSYDSKNLAGECKLNQDLTMKARVYSVYKCEKLDPSTLDESKWDDIKSKVKDGLIKLQDCSLVDGIKEAQ